MPRLRRADCSAPGIQRRRAGRGFVYVAPDGRRITDAETLARVRDLAVPPAWQDVWICPWPNGHLQAVGIDAAGRKQYRYHDEWRLRRDQEKFDHMLDFAGVLPRLRRVVARHLAGDEPTRDRVLACAIRLLDIGFFRVGTEGYAEDNGTVGLATIEKGHARLGNGILTFDYPSKGGRRRLQSVVDAEALQVVKQLKGRRGGGRELLAYRHGRRWVDVRSADINTYLKEVTGGEYTAKDFRTWNATVLAAVSLAVAAPAASASVSARKRAVAWAVKEVAHYLGNTPAVCRSSYIDPRVVDRFRAGVTIAPALDRLGEDVQFGHLPTQGAIEAAVRDLLADAPAARAA